MDNAILDIEAIRARHAAATKGPWWCDGPEWMEVNDITVYCGEKDDAQCLCNMGAPIVAVDNIDEARVSYANGVFVAASWQDVADLLAEVERLRAENAALKLTAKHLPAQTVAPFSETEMGKWIAEQSKRPPPNVHIGGNESLIPKE